MWKHILGQLALLLFLYLEVPHFIKEQNVVRLAENNIIYFFIIKCQIELN